MCCRPYEHCDLRCRANHDRAEALLRVLIKQNTHDFAALRGEIGGLVAKYGWAGLWR